MVKYRTFGGDFGNAFADSFSKSVGMAMQIEATKNNQLSDTLFKLIGLQTQFEGQNLEIDKINADWDSKIAAAKNPAERDALMKAKPIFKKKDLSSLGNLSTNLQYPGHSQPKLTAPTVPTQNYQNSYTDSGLTDKTEQAINKPQVNSPVIQNVFDIMKNKGTVINTDFSTRGISREIPINPQSPLNAPVVQKFEGTDTTVTPVDLDITDEERSVISQKGFDPSTQTEIENNLKQFKEIRSRKSQIDQKDFDAYYPQILSGEITVANLPKELLLTDKTNVQETLQYPAKIGKISSVIPDLNIITKNLVNAKGDLNVDVGPGTTNSPELGGILGSIKNTLLPPISDLRNYPILNKLGYIATAAGIGALSGAPAIVPWGPIAGALTAGGTEAALAFTPNKPGTEIIKGASKRLPSKLTQAYATSPRAGESNVSSEGVDKTPRGYNLNENADELFDTHVSNIIDFTSLTGELRKSILKQLPSDDPLNQKEFPVLQRIPESYLRNKTFQEVLEKRGTSLEEINSRIDEYNGTIIQKQYKDMKSQGMSDQEIKPVLDSMIKQSERPLEIPKSPSIPKGSKSYGDIQGAPIADISSGFDDLNTKTKSSMSTTDMVEGIFNKKTKNKDVIQVVKKPASQGGNATIVYQGGKPEQKVQSEKIANVNEFKQVATMLSKQGDIKSLRMMADYIEKYGFIDKENWKNLDADIQDFLSVASQKVRSGK